MGQAHINTNIRTRLIPMNIVTIMHTVMDMIIAMRIVMPRAVTLMRAIRMNMVRTDQDTACPPCCRVRVAGRSDLVTAGWLGTACTICCSLYHRRWRYRASGVQNIIRGQVFDEYFLMTVATLGAFAIESIPKGLRSCSSISSESCSKAWQ